MVHEWVIARLAYAELENRAISGPYLKTLHSMDWVSGIAASIYRAENGTNHVKVGGPVRPRVDEENPYQLADFYRDRMVRISFDDAVEHHEVRPLIHHAFAVTRHHSLVVRIAVELTLLDRHLVRLGPSTLRIDDHHPIHAICDVGDHGRRAAVIHECTRDFSVEFVGQVCLARDRRKVLAGRELGGMDVDAVGDLHVIDEMNVNSIALAHAQNRARHCAAVGPCVVLQAGADIDDFFLDRDGKFALRGKGGR